ncbi:glycosyltransferase domain-containing protein [Providencia stuartii]|uniref:glycosyltransferase domain-containing protein n=1 Tax=Providencia stuartii TaxID=588 RepID=UPI00331B3074
MKNTRLVYTVILGNYDTLKEVKHSSKNIDYICITDNKNITSKTWKVITIDDCENFTLENRRYKFLPFLYFDYEESIYVDGNISITGDMTFIFDKYLKQHDIAIPKHPFRNCIYDEAHYCIKIKKTTTDEIENQLNYYHHIGFPKNYGLFENNVIVRKHTPAIIKMMHEWWDIFQLYSKRDQLSLCFLLWKNNHLCLNLIEGPRYSNKYFSFNLHSHEDKLSLVKKIFLISSIRCKQNIFYFTINKLRKFCVRKKNEHYR